MLSTLIVLAATTAVQAGPTPVRQNDPYAPWVIGPWAVTCVRDGNFTSWNHVEGCGVNASAGTVKLFFTRTATEAFTGVSLDGCPPSTGLSRLSVRALNTPGPARVRLLRDALRRTIRAAVAHCEAGPALDGFVVRESDIAVIRKSQRRPGGRVRGRIDLQR
jgi:hypothetical protein